MGAFEDRLEEVLEPGWKLRSELSILLKDAFKHQVKLFQIRHPQLAALEKRFYKAYSEFLIHELVLNDYIITMSENDSLNPRIMNAFDKYFKTVESQREGLRILLQEIGRILNGHRSQAVNHMAIQIAFLAFLATIVLGFVQIYIASISEPIILYPPRY